MNGTPLSSNSVVFPCKIEGNFAQCKHNTTVLKSLELLPVVDEYTGLAPVVVLLIEKKHVQIL